MRKIIFVWFSIFMGRWLKYFLSKNPSGFYFFILKTPMKFDCTVSFNRPNNKKNTIEFVTYTSFKVKNYWFRGKVVLNFLNLNNQDLFHQQNSV